MIPQAIKSLQSVIILNSFWKQDWIETVAPGDWATECLELLTENEINELNALSVTCHSGRRALVGVHTNLRHYAISYFDIPSRVFDYALNELIWEQLKWKREH